jgi:hypothetical protein
MRQYTGLSINTPAAAGTAKATATATATTVVGTNIA